MTIYNADGSSPEMCGNGLRCLAQFWLDQQFVSKTDTLSVETKSGQLSASFVDQLVKVFMGPAITDLSKYPIQLPGHHQLIDTQVNLNNRSYAVTAVSMGNPHAIIFTDNIETFPLHDLGAWVNSSDIFPEGVNLEIASVVDSSTIQCRVWERGVGETNACGTGACATAIAGCLTQRTECPTTVHLPGGPLTIEWDQSKNNVWMTGPAESVFNGSILV